MHVAVGALDEQAGLGELGLAPGPHEEGDIAARCQEPSAEISANPAGAHHEDAHGSSGLRHPHDANFHQLPDHPGPVCLVRYYQA